MRKAGLFFILSIFVLVVWLFPLFSNADDGLIGYWKFDGNGANEVAGSPAAALQSNAVFRSTGGKLGGYLYIPAQGDSVKIPYVSMFDLPNSFTIEFWFRQRANQSFFQDLVYKGTPINNYNFRVFRQLWNENNFGPIITGYTSSQTRYWTQTSNPNQLVHNEWHHVAFTKDATQSAYYLDGMLVHSSIQADPAVTGAHDIMVGGSAVDTDIDNLRIYNRALPLSEVLQNSGLSGRQQICAPQQTQCVGNILQACAGDRFSWITAQYCDNGCDANTLACKALPIITPTATSTPQTTPASVLPAPSSVSATSTPLAPPSPPVVSQPSVESGAPPSTPISESSSLSATSTLLLSMPSTKNSSGSSTISQTTGQANASTTDQMLPEQSKPSAQRIDTPQEQEKLKIEALNFAKYLASLSRETDSLQKTGASLPESFKQALASARDLSEYVRTTSELRSVQETRSHIENLRDSLNEYIPSLERIARLPGVLRIANRQIAQATRLRKSAASAATRRKIDVKDLLADMDAHILKMASALDRLTQETSSEDLLAFSTENFSDNLEAIREIERHVHAVINIKQFIKQIQTEAKQLNQRIAKLKKSSQTYREVKAVLFEIEHNLSELRPLANTRLTSESADQILSYVESLTDALDVAKEALNILNVDALSSQLSRLFASPSGNIKRFE
ncbi:hypothetical protein HY621_04405 [Candidatus Uhrbacteria bacterium]|nr:hypothetical protein [Candidatus Uhrbacteria bacterium]